MSDSQLSIVLRPTSFDTMVGNSDVVGLIKKQLDEGTTPRALMFVGPAGTGKTTLARIIARAAQGFDFPLDEEPDVTELNAAHFTGVDEMRELVDAQNCYPMRGTYRIIILDEAHMLSKNAQNLLLKPFEEPDASTIWIICTTEVGKIIKAIRTRCQVHQLKALTARDIHDLLVMAAEYTGTKDFAAFEAEAIKRKLDSPRPLLNAFELFVKGMSAADAVNSQTQAYAPLHKDIAFSVVYGDWNSDRMVFGGKVKAVAVKTLLNGLEDAFKKKKAAEDDDKTEAEIGSDTDSPEADEEALSRPEVATGIRAVTAAFLKNMVIKGNVKAAESLRMLAACVPAAADTAMAYPLTIGALLQINIKLNSKP